MKDSKRGIAGFSSENLDLQIIVQVVYRLIGFSFYQKLRQKCLLRLFLQSSAGQG